jgi:hypothetical protein
MQLQSKGGLVKGFGYLLEAYLGLVVRYSILVRVSGYLLFCEISLIERHCTCSRIYIEKALLGFLPQVGFPG